ncbi:MAG: hypothetical protein ACQKBY_09780 [Verrucomicrobiales bacterium]
MADEKNIPINFRTNADTSGAKQAEKSIEGVGQAAKDAEGEVKGFGGQEFLQPLITETEKAVQLLEEMEAAAIETAEEVAKIQPGGEQGNGDDFTAPLKEQLEQIKGLKKEASDLGDRLKDDTAKGAKKAADGFDDMGRNIKVLKRLEMAQAAGEIGRVITDMADAARDHGFDELANGADLAGGALTRISQLFISGMGIMELMPHLSSVKAALGGVGQTAARMAGPIGAAAAVGWGLKEALEGVAEANHAASEAQSRYLMGLRGGGKSEAERAEIIKAATEETNKAYDSEIAKIEELKAARDTLLTRREREAELKHDEVDFQEEKDMAELREKKEKDLISDEEYEREKLKIRAGARNEHHKIDQQLIQDQIENERGKVQEHASGRERKERELAEKEGRLNQGVEAGRLTDEERKDIRRNIDFANRTKDPVEKENILSENERILAEAKRREKEALKGSDPEGLRAEIETLKEQIEELRAKEKDAEKEAQPRIEELEFSGKRADLNNSRRNELDQAEYRGLERIERARKKKEAEAKAKKEADKAKKEEEKARKKERSTLSTDAAQAGQDALRLISAEINESLKSRAKLDGKTGDARGARELVEPLRRAIRELTQDGATTSEIGEVVRLINELGPMLGGLNEKQRSDMVALKNSLKALQTKVKNVEGQIKHGNR